MFFDFHVHPTLKSLFSDPPEKFSPWENLDTRLIPDLLRWCTDFPYILRSQANLSQLWYNECRLVCVALYAPERQLLNNPLILGQSGKSLGVYLNRSKIENIINGTLKPFDLLLHDDLPTLLNPAAFGVTDKHVQPLTLAQDFDETRTDTIYVVFSVEGCHSLANSLNLRQPSLSQMLTNLDTLRARVPVLSINLTHMEQSGLCNHAYGMQFLKHADFKPTGKGLSGNGAKMVEHCYRHGILIDLKHMSVMARQQLYSLRQSPGFQAIQQPLICTHAGFTGIPLGHVPNYIYRFHRYRTKGYARLYMGKPWLHCTQGTRPSFNSSSINLYDEEIVLILQSGGLIGLSMDKRILGYADPEGSQLANQDIYPLEEEFISLREAAYFFSKASVGSAFADGACIENREVEEAGPVNPRLGEYHLRHFMGHVVHLIKVARAAGYPVAQALKQVCLGTDFDGMINPLWVCDSVDQLVYFRAQFERAFVRFAHHCEVPLPPGFDVAALAQDLFYENGKRFVLTRLP
ncbi:MAG: membrane dipeptidase [Cyclobacteriaceae bacterium]|jgi:microsomal dipeptidase-like Zn-dependent dipeptidase|nr:membrane dipeptidase [Cyclobacteriaceae bacterium]